MGTRSLLILSGLALFLDVPSARAYNEHEAWTETLGRFFFHSYKELVNVPIPSTPFETLSYLAVAVLVLFWGIQNSRVWRSLLLVAALIPVMAFSSFFFGLLQGHSVSLGATQVHYLPFVGVWLVLGYFLGSKPGFMPAFCKMLFFIALWRSLYALGVFALAYDFQMGSREFLIDHPASIFLALGMLYAGYRMWVTRDPRVRFFFGLSLLPMAAAFVLNDRRTAFAGALLFAGLLPWVLPLNLRGRVWPYYRVAAILGVLGATAAAALALDQHSFIGAFGTELMSGGGPLTYRHMENFNLLSAVKEAPWFGLGFGTNYPQVMVLPDISQTFDLFQAIPHNTVYFLWAFMGPLGIGAFAALISLSMMIILRCARWSRTRTTLLHALFAFMILCQWLMYAFYDMGLIEARSGMLFGICVGSLYTQYARFLKEYYHARIKTASAGERTRFLRPLVLGSGPEASATRSDFHSAG